MANADSHDKGLEAIPPSLFAGFGGAVLPGKGQKKLRRAMKPPSKD